MSDKKPSPRLYFDPDTAYQVAENAQQIALLRSRVYVMEMEQARLVREAVYEVQIAAVAPIIWRNAELAAEVHELRDEVAQLSGQVGALVGQVSGLANELRRGKFKGQK